MFVWGKPSLGQEPVLVAYLDVLMQTRDRCLPGFGLFGVFYYLMNEEEGEGRCRCCLDGGVVLPGQ